MLTIADGTRAVLEAFHARMREEDAAPPTADWQDRRLLAVGPETGRLLHALARGIDRPHILEIGTAFGYSTVWLADAARASGGRVLTIELARHKSAHAREMLARADLLGHVDLRVADALDVIETLDPVFDMVLLDLWKDLYVPCLSRFLPKLRPGATIVADNMIRPGGENAGRYRQAVRAVPGIESMLLPIGTGVEISRLPS